MPTVVQVLDGTAPANTAAVRVDLDPGTQYRYSGGGYTIAQLAMTDVTGQSFPALMQRLVLGPLAMKQSTYDQPLPRLARPEAAAGIADGKAVAGKRHVYPEMAAAGLWTTPSDLARFAIGLQKMLAGKGPAVEGDGREHDDAAQGRLRPRARRSRKRGDRGTSRTAAPTRGSRRCSSRARTAATGPSS